MKQSRFCVDRFSGRRDEFTFRITGRHRDTRLLLHAEHLINDVVKQVCIINGHECRSARNPAVNGRLLRARVYAQLEGAFK